MKLVTVKRSDYTHIGALFHGGLNLALENRGV